MYVDPDGRIAWWLGALLFGAATGGITYTASAILSDGGLSNWNWGDFFKSVGMGSLSGLATGGVGKFFGSGGDFLREFSRGVAHGLVQGGLSTLDGGNFWSGAASGGLSSWAGSGFRKIPKFGVSKEGASIFGSLAGGLGAAATGGNFLKGAAIGLMNVQLNHLAQNFEFFADKKEAFRNMQDLQKSSGVEIAGTSATPDGKEGEGVLVQVHPENTKTRSKIEYYEEGTQKTAKYVKDGVFRKYILGDEHYHTHPSDYSYMQEVSGDDKVIFGQWSKAYVLYSNRLYSIQQYKSGDFYYQRTKITY